ncbi:unnamed protein product [Rotaria sordida]|uniref:Uncharacterized protein n=1 Tax=Rotaria sordida TaxID=392033 RepID=A0A814NWB0_9BILA|nr:unnamed protein product [Rotaria sordida]
MMSDTQPLLPTADRFSIDDSNSNRRRSAINKLFNWRQYFAFTKIDQKYENLDDDNDGTRNEPVIGYFQLFRFADRLDLIMIFLGLCFVLLYGMSSTASLVVFSRLTSAFALQSFIGRCSSQQNISVSINNSKGCPWNAEPNIFNYDSLQK